MKTSRREFLRFSALAGTGLVLSQYSSFALASKAGKFLDKIGVSTGIANNGILASAGYSYVEENVKAFLAPLEADSVFDGKLAQLKESKLPVYASNSFLPANLKCVGPTPLHEDILKFGEVAFRRAKMAGMKTIVFGSGGARAIPQGFSREEARNQFISLCKQLGPIAKKYDVIISLEPLNTGECNFINSVAEGGEIVKAVDHENFRLLADFYHMLKENESPENIRKYGHLLFHTHIAEKNGRTAPGVNHEDFVPFFKALKNVKFKGCLTIECSWKNLGEQAADSLKYLRGEIASV